MRSVVRLLALVAITLLLAGCVKVNLDLEVSPDNTVSGTAILAVDQGLLELVGQSADQLFQEMDLSDLPEGAAVDPYEDDGFVGQQITFDDVALSEFSGGETLGGSGEELSITRVGDEFHVAGRLDMSSSEFGAGQVPEGLLDSFEFKISITFPGPVASATGEVDGNTVTWEPRIGQNTEIRAVASAIPSGGSPSLLIVLVAAGALVLGAIVFLLVGRGRPGAPAAGPIGEGAATPIEADAIGGPTEGGPIEGGPTATAPLPGAPPPPPPAEPPPTSTPGGAVPPEDEESPPPVPPVSG
jgi:hypothetical protein